MTVLVRFALYLDLMLVFGLPLFQLHALRQAERSSPLGKKFVVLTTSAAAIGLALSAVSMLLMAKAMTGATDINSIEQHMFEMMLTDTSFGMAWCLRMATPTALARWRGSLGHRRICFAKACWWRPATPRRFCLRWRSFRNFWTRPAPS